VFGVVPNQTSDPGATPPPWALKVTDIGDGTSNTLLLSEGLSVTVTTTTWYGPMGEQWYGNMGGALFSAAYTPNSSVADQIYGTCPQTAGDGGYRAPCVSLGPNVWFTPCGSGSQAAARSSHIGGVNAAMADGSIHFYDIGVSLSVWRAMGTANGKEAVSVPQ
jgi:prepilin-type processing-associated H-X9-DG protein